MVRKKKVLIFEDFEGIRTILLKHLQNRDFEICIATNLSEALGHLNGTSLDLFITDNDMKNKSALRIISHMRDTTSYMFTPIILLISGEKERYQKQLGDCNIAMYLSKPFDVGLFNNLLDRLSRK